MSIEELKRRRMEIVPASRTPPEQRSNNEITETRKWEALPLQSLINLFQRLELPSLILDVPFVCKSWYDAASDPRCWHNLNFPDFGNSMNFFFLDSPQATAQAWRLMFTYNLCYEDGYDRFIKLAVDQSQGQVTSLNLPSNCSSDALTYIAQRCPNLKYVSLRPKFLCRQGRMFAELVSSWKNIEVLGFGGSEFLGEILSQVVVHCPKFLSLSCSDCIIGVKEASAIVKFPRLEYLRMHKSQISRPALVMVLKQCHELQLLELINCVGFVRDAEIHKLASAIGVFICQECKGPVVLDE